jgi:hypothetical protein
MISFFTSAAFTVPLVASANLRARVWLLLHEIYLAAL